MEGLGTTCKKIKLEVEEIKPSSGRTADEYHSDKQADGTLYIPSEELDLERTLLGGQSFRWCKTDDDTTTTNPIFRGVVRDLVLDIWRTSSETIAFKKLNKDKVINNPAVDLERVNKVLIDYFQLKYNLKDLYREWSSKDYHLSGCCDYYKGFRILRQNPEENLFSFICATNNNIKRISLMIDGMCRKFGTPLYTDGETGLLYCSFPSAERLAQDDVFESLRYKLGFGYRAKFITGTAQKLVKLASNSDLGNMTPLNYLLSLRDLPYKETCKRLMNFPGIGRKVADCICLMSMDHLNSVPIDCHIYEIVCRHYMPDLRTKYKTLTENVHDIIGNHFQNLHGPLAGWSTSVLFIAELKHLKAGATKTTVKKTKGKTKQKAVVKLEADDSQPSRETPRRSCRNHR